MKLLFFRIKKYLIYWLKSVGPHGLHSPFLFDLYNKAIIPSRKFRLDTVEQLRKNLKTNDHLIDLYDLKTQTNYRKTIASIASTSLSQPKFSSFLNRLIDHLQIKNALETGTSLGINALYMAGNNSIEKLTTIEASPIIASIAKKQFSELLQNKIQLQVGTIQEVFESIVIKEKPELCFVDADHRSDAVLFCVNTLMNHSPDIKCIIIHDIYWSRDMFKAWNKLQSDNRFNLTVDIFQAGLIFPTIEMPKQHFTVRF